jgi:hypothetical protein
MSDEDTVIVSEQRGCGDLRRQRVNQRWEEPSVFRIVPTPRGIGLMVVRSRMSREAHVRSLWGAGGESPPAYPASC